ncbi:MAG: ferredoxin--NADP reductase [Cyclobacteriaceae bacterium]|nr:ferredoxin--NADP reductase [Cyclobacteriaceae bacterium]
MLELQWPEAGNPLFTTVRIERVIAETSDTKTFVLTPIEKSIPYKAGQFITFVFQSLNKQERRSYSFSSSPELGEPLAVTVKRLPNGMFSRPLFEQAQPGDRLTVLASASGFFTLPANLKEDGVLVFLAAGSGITPIYSMIKTALAQNSLRPIVLIYSNSSPERTIFKKELEALRQKSRGRLIIEWLFSNNQNLMRARLNKPVLKELLHIHVQARISKAQFFLCGPFDYMRMAAIVLQTEGVPVENIRREVFTPDVPISKELPPDTNPHSVTVHIQKKVHALTVQYPDSILSAARKQGIDLPYSCEAGRCGSCVASCTSGKVWMRYNEVLTDKEVALGRVLVCNSFPVGGDVEIKFDQ